MTDCMTLPVLPTIGMLLVEDEEAGLPPVEVPAVPDMPAATPDMPATAVAFVFIAIAELPPIAIVADCIGGAGLPPEPAATSVLALPATPASLFSPGHCKRMPTAVTKFACTPKFAEPWHSASGNGPCVDSMMM